MKYLSVQCLIAVASILCVEVSSTRSALSTRYGVDFSGTLLSSRTNASSTDRDLIIGGTLASPFFVGSHAMADIERSTGLCGATLIHPDILVTAAHCGIGNVFFAGSFVFIGATVLSGSDAVDEVAVVDVMYHPSYDPRALGNDIMLVKIASPALSPPVRWNRDATVPSVGEELVVVGFGLTEEGLTSSDLLEGRLNAIDIATCNDAYNDLGEGNAFGASTLCAASNVQATCSGDSGSPLFTEAGLLVGVVSFGIRDNQENICVADRAYPSGFAKISGNVDFLTRGICDLSDDPPTSCPVRTMQTRRPTPRPIPKPAPAPTRRPTRRPTRWPTRRPTRPPTKRPTRRPTRAPTTRRPSQGPSKPLRFSLSITPTPFPTRRPTKQPTTKPSPVPTKKPTTARPTVQSSASPTFVFTERPSLDPTLMVSDMPSSHPSHIPSVLPPAIEDFTALTPYPTIRNISIAPSLQPPSVLISTGTSNISTLLPSTIPLNQSSLPPTSVPVSNGSSSRAPAIDSPMTPTIAATTFEPPQSTRSVGSNLLRKSLWVVGTGIIVSLLP